MRERGIDGVDIKWPNDVLLKGRKVCGILAEGMNAGTSHRIILGIGVNLNHSNFPPALAETATSIARETGAKLSADEFLSPLLPRIAHWYGRWRKGEYASVVERWESLSSFARGARVAVTTEDEQITGTTDGLTEAGALRIVTDHGETKIILTGEVARLRKIPDVLPDVSPDVLVDTHKSDE
jgi:BirA family biotin operon repressor/biotin-[acetyl-CoA-carboxylase] ligase